MARDIKRVDDGKLNLSLSATIRNTFNKQPNETNIAALERSTSLGIVNWINNNPLDTIADFEFFGSQYPIGAFNDSAHGGTLTFRVPLAEKGLYVYAPTSTNVSAVPTHAGVEDYSIEMGGNIAKMIYIDEYYLKNIEEGIKITSYQIEQALFEIFNAFKIMAWAERIKANEALAQNQRIANTIETKVQAENELIHTGVPTADQFNTQDVINLYYNIQATVSKMIRKTGLAPSDIKVLLDEVPFSQILSLNYQNTNTGLFNIGAVQGNSFYLPSGVMVESVSSFKDLVWDQNPFEGNHKPILGYIATNRAFIAPKQMLPVSTNNGGHFRGQTYMQFLMKIGKKQDEQGRWLNRFTITMSEDNEEVFIVGEKEIKAIKEADNARFKSIQAFIPEFLAATSIERFVRRGFEGFGTYNQPTIDATDAKVIKTTKPGVKNLKMDANHDNAEDGSGKSIGTTTV